MKKNKAFNLMNSSFLMNYYDSRVIDNQLLNVTIIDDEEEFCQLIGVSSHDNCDGFSRNNKIYIGPNGTAHTVINNVLHNLSSSFVYDKKVLNGISSCDGKGALNYINGGLTEYLATCISGEPERYCHLVVRFFREIDKMINEMFGPNQVLFESYIFNNTYFLECFINNFCTYKFDGHLVDWDFFINNFVFFDSDVVNKLINNIHTNMLKNNKKSLFNFNNREIDMDRFYELSAVGLIKKAYYDLIYFNPGASADDIKIGMQAMFNGDLQYISNKRGVRALLQSAMAHYSLIDVVMNNYDKFDGIPMGECLVGMKR